MGQAIGLQLLGNTFFGPTYFSGIGVSEVSEIGVKNKLLQTYSDFVGRQRELKKLTRILHYPEKNTGIKKALIYGSPFVGKSEIAIAFANKNLNEFEFVWTIQAKTDESIEQSYLEFAHTLNILPIKPYNRISLIEAVHRHLEALKNQKPYLLIMDNAEDIPLLPQRGNGIILITSRNRNLISPEMYLKVHPFSKRVAIKLFKKILIQGDITIKCDDNEKIQNIVKHLDYFPLALSQFAHFIATSPSLNIEDCLSHLEKDPKSIFSRLSTIPERVPRPFLASWKLILDKLEKSDPKALNWLCIIAFLNPDNILDTLLMNWITCKNGSQENNGLVRDDIIKSLLDYSLIRWDKDRKTMSINRLFQEILKAIMSPDEQKNYLSEAADIFSNFNTLDNLDPLILNNWPILGNYAGHIHLLLKCSIKPIKKAPLYLILGLWSQIKGQEEEAFKYYENSYEIYKDYIDKASKNNNGNSGKIYKGFVEDNNNIAYMYTLTLHNLGWIYLNQGNHLKAKALHSEALQIKKQIFAENTNQPEIALTYSALGFAFFIEGNLQEAFKNLHNARNIEDKFFNENKNDPQRSITLLFLGSLYSFQGNYEKAFENFKLSLEIAENIYGKDVDHLLIAAILNSIGTTYACQEKYDDAFKNFDRSLSIFMRIHEKNEKHPNIINTLLHQSFAFIQERKYNEASKLLTRALNLRNTPSLSEISDPYLPIISAFLGIFFVKQGHNDKGLEEFNKALDIGKTTYGGNSNPLVLIFSLIGIGKAYYHKSFFREASEKFSDALNMERKIYAPYHPHIAKTLNLLGNTYFKEGDYKNASMCYDEAMEIFKKIYNANPNHEDIAFTLSSIGIICFKQGNYNKAIEKYTHAINILNNIHGAGSNHPDIVKLLSLINMANFKKKLKNIVRLVLLLELIGFIIIYLKPNFIQNNIKEIFIKFKNIFKLFYSS